MKYLIGATASLVVLAAGSAQAADQTFNFDCAPIAGDGRNERTVDLEPGDTATINVAVSGPDACVWGIASGDVTPNQTGNSVVAVYNVGATGTASVHVYKPGVGGYRWNFTHDGAAPAPAPVPTMSEWAMILLGLMMAGAAALIISRRQTA